MESCSTCATILSSTPAYTKEKLSLPQDRRVACCARIICGKCIHKNERFADYCPYCQVSTGPTSLPQGLREPPAYTSLPSSSSRTAHISGAPPPYSAASPTPNVNDEKAALAQDATKEDAPDILHFLDHRHDSVSSLSLRYGVPAHALRRSNNITSDHLLLGRRTVLIPGEYYRGGVSLSPRPIEGEDGELRKGKIRRFMTSCKVSDYDIAVLYLEQSSYDLENAVTAYLDDEKWEQENPASGKGKKADIYKNRGPFWRGL
ncbi:hypothetical protein LB506_002851 [Fusarium annulatum]|uniref:LysM domain-containing protein n=1 Tax=Fusarium proliferatum (strain ET1) TaxID=1227346 RepID=A0A1L7VHK3_FUSPR|nr:uncharacterized protein FPRO_04988 [Fusarium proliferatum ET1]KAI1048231.1 hypothetical protein LB506_002851 [Fusarium annulatum]CVL08042.1 uncharacterized protein FPRN_04839 [Fusarium proliferatum]CZR40089.1 uncharacterized protein FPRO_04988 [Fusarium proliferatum ET1]